MAAIRDLPELEQEIITMLIWDELAPCEVAAVLGLTPNRRRAPPATRPPTARALEAPNCLLDVSPDVQAARLTRRGDDPSLLPHDQAFAEWMRGHARDPRHLPHVLSTNGWEAMRWDRWSSIAPIAGNWGMGALDTSELTLVQVADEVLTWSPRAGSGTRG